MEIPQKFFDFLYFILTAWVSPDSIMRRFMISDLHQLSLYIRSLYEGFDSSQRCRSLRTSFFSTSNLFTTFDIKSDRTQSLYDALYFGDSFDRWV
jgi:hypothetical protein